MANLLYPLFKESLLSGAINLSSDTIKVALIDTGTYTYSAAHEFYSSVSGVVGTPQTLANKTIALGVFDADDSTYPSLTGSTVEAYIIYKDTGVAGTSNLIGYFDSAASGLPLTPDGNNVTLTFDSGASKIFAL